MSGIVGMVGKANVSHELYDALTLLQHPVQRSLRRLSSIS